MDGMNALNLKYPSVFVCLQWRQTVLVGYSGCSADLAEPQESRQSLGSALNAKGTAVFGVSARPEHVEAMSAHQEYSA